MVRVRDAAWSHLAYAYHSGQWSSLYAYASSGTPTLGLAFEVQESIATARKYYPEDVEDLEKFSEWAEAWEDAQPSTD